MSDYFSLNLDILAKKNRSLARYIHNTDPDGSFEVLRSESGHFIVRQHAQDGTYRFIHSRVNPLQEARTWVDCQSVDLSHTVILGIGLAYHVAELRRVFPDCQRILLMEADPSLFRLALEFIDLSDILSDPRVHVFVGIDLPSFEQTISQYTFESFSYHSFLPAMYLHPESYYAIIWTHDQHLCRMRLHGCGEEATKDVLPLAKGIETLLSEMRTS